MNAPLKRRQVKRRQAQSGAPRIGLVVDREGEGDRSVYLLKRAYVSAVQRAGGLALLLPYPDASGPLEAQAAATQAMVQATLQLLDGLLITGGAFDIPPETYGESKRAGLGALKPERSIFELELARQARDVALPLLGICGGMQLLNVLYGGTLIQDLPTERPEAMTHESSAPRTEVAHSLELLPGTKLAQLLPCEARVANSTHHQAVDRLGEGLSLAAQAPDGVVEALEDPALPFFLGTQWHPEALVQAVPAQQHIYDAFIDAARARGKG